MTFDIFDGRTVKKIDVLEQDGFVDAERPSVSDPDSGRIHFDQVKQRYQISENGGPWKDLTDGAEFSVIAEATEALTAGNFVSLSGSGTTILASKASGAVGGSEANGFIKEDIASGSTGTVYFSGINNQLSGLTVNTRYFLSETPGEVTATQLEGTGKIHQFLGTGASTAGIIYRYAEPILLG